MSSGLSSSTRALIDELISFLYSLDSRNASAAFSYSFSAKKGTPAGVVIGCLFSPSGADDEESGGRLRPDEWHYQ